MGRACITTILVLFCVPSFLQAFPEKKKLTEQETKKKCGLALTQLQREALGQIYHDSSEEHDLRVKRVNEGVPHPQGRLSSIAGKITTWRREGRDIVKTIMAEMLALKLPKTSGIPAHNKYSNIFSRPDPSALYLIGVERRELDKVPVSRDGQFHQVHWENHPLAGKDIPIAVPSGEGDYLRLRIIAPRSEAESVYHQLTPTERLRLTHSIVKTIQSATYDENAAGETGFDEGGLSSDEFRLLAQGGFSIDPIAALKQAKARKHLGVCRNGTQIAVGVHLELGFPFNQVFMNSSREEQHARLAVLYPELREQPYYFESTPEAGIQTSTEHHVYVNYAYTPSLVDPREAPAFFYNGVSKPQ